VSCPGCLVMAVYRRTSTKLRARKSRIANVRARKIEEREKSAKNLGARKIKERESANTKAWNLRPKKERESASAKSSAQERESASAKRKKKACPALCICLRQNFFFLKLVKYF
jgi:hypothetical protein